MSPGSQAFRQRTQWCLPLEAWRAWKASEVLAAQEVSRLGLRWPCQQSSQGRIPEAQSGRDAHAEDDAWLILPVNRFRQPVGRLVPEFPGLDWQVPD